MLNLSGFSLHEVLPREASLPVRSKPAGRRLVIASTPFRLSM